MVRRLQEPAPAKAGGEFTLGNRRYCYPLTVTDHASRYLLLCEALESTREGTAFEAFKQLFRERGLPLSIRSDNGVPFASPNALFNLSKLAVWWLRLGIKEVDEGIWLVSFMHYDLGYIDLEQKTLQPLDNPFGPGLSPMSLVHSVTYVSRLYKGDLATSAGFEPAT